PDQILHVVATVEAEGFQVHRSDGQSQTVLGCVGIWPPDFDPRAFELLPGVVQVLRISSPYKLASRTFKPENTVLDLPGAVTIGGTEVALMAGPCTIESREQLEAIAPLVAAAGASVMRGGAFKPRTSPYSFQGMGEEGLRHLRDTASKHGLLVVSEVMDRTQ